jgi:hypothetical protein
VVVGDLIINVFDIVNKKLCKQTGTTTVYGTNEHRGAYMQRCLAGCHIPTIIQHLSTMLPGRLGSDSFVSIMYAYIWASK